MGEDGFHSPMKGYSGLNESCVFSAMEMNFAFSAFICNAKGIDRIRPPMKQNAKGAMLHESKENSNATGPSSTITPNLIIKVPGCIVLDWA